MTISLVAPYFRPSDPARQKELDECLVRNVENPMLERIVLLIDDGAPLPITSDKVTVQHLSHRPTYADWLTVAEQMGLRGAVLLANSDIYFDQTIELVHDVLGDPTERVFMSLSRWEVEGGETRRHPNPHWSQDVWALSVGDKNLDPVRARLDFKLGVPRCDNKAAYVFATAGWSVRNPCNFYPQLPLA